MNRGEQMQNERDVYRLELVDGKEMVAIAVGWVGFAHGGGNERGLHGSVLEVKAGKSIWTSGAGKIHRPRGRSKFKATRFSLSTTLGVRTAV